MEWIATCPHETVDVLESELLGLKVEVIERLYRGIIFNCNLEEAYKAHLQLHTASRIQRVISKFDASDINRLKNGINEIKWIDWLRAHKPFKISLILTDDFAALLSQESIIDIVKNSIEQSPFEKQKPKFRPDLDTAIDIVLFIRNNKCLLSIDTAGRALHKRGWRVNGHPAVLKETLAASILMLAGYKGDKALIDGMCGSGTIPIEAAYIALNKAAMIHRGKDDFAIEHLANFDRSLWRKVSDQLRAQKKSQLLFPIYASDINDKFVEVAKKSSLKARVEKYITFETRSFIDIFPKEETGLLIMNLPYGERIGSDYINRLYQNVGDVIKERFKNWDVALLVPTDAPIKSLKLKTTHVFNLKNGALEVKLLVAKR